MKDLAGMFVIAYADDGTFQTGRVVAQVDADHFLVSIDRTVEGVAPEALPAALVPISDFTDRLESGRAVYEFFDTKYARDAWAAWLIGPEADEAAPQKSVPVRH